MAKNNIFMVNVQGNSITRSDIKKCIEYFEEIERHNIDQALIRIVGYEEIIAFDFSLIGHLILIKKNRPDISIEIHLTKNSFELNESLGNTPAGISVIWKLRQSLVHTYYSTNEFVYTIFDYNGSQGKDSDTDRNDLWIVLSKKIIPVIYISIENYDHIFVNPVKFKAIQDLEITKNINTYSPEYIYQVLRKYLFKHKRKQLYFHIVSQLAFYRSLQATKILQYYLFEQINPENRNLLGFPDQKKDLQLSRIRKNKQEYWDIVVSIFDELKGMPPIYHLIYFSLVSSELVPSTITKTRIHEEAQLIFQLWEFTKQLVYGINELAKNIIQHSTNNRGIITGYINDRSELVLNVFDHGKDDMIKTFIENTEREYERAEPTSRHKEALKEDLQTIKNHSFDFSSFFKASGGSVLNQQTKRALAHLGILYFSKLISSNNGELLVSSHNLHSDQTAVYRGNLTYDIEIIPIGTDYNIILPTTNLSYKPLGRIYSPVSQSIKENISLGQLFDYEEIRLCQGCLPTINVQDDVKYYFNVILEANNKKGKEFEETLWKNFIYSISEGNNILSEIKTTNDFICIGFNEIENLNASQLFRFLGNYELEFPSTNLIIYDIRTELLFELVQMNESFFDLNKDELPYWNPNIITLFYSYIKDVGKSKGTFYFTDALGGTKKADFIYINSLIKKNNYNATLLRSEYHDSDVRDNFKSFENVLFYLGTTLLPFDLLIKNRNNNPLFINNSKTLLNNELKNPDQTLSSEKQFSDNLKSKIENLPGFKLSDSHFRLGSKIHISDFYYAKRFFQNSFYASRFAFIIAKFIIENQLKDIKNEKITLIGYGMYSELLVSLVEQYLNYYYKEHDKNKRKMNISHNLFSDSEELNLVKKYGEQIQKAIIIVPIASTFTTSIKIEEKLLKDCQIIGPHLNVLVVSNGSMNEKNKISADEDIEGKYGWLEVFPIEKKVNVKAFFDPDQTIRTQIYFLSLSSQWHQIQDCPMCFSQGNRSQCKDEGCKTCKNHEVKEMCPLAEKPLLTTDKTSVTPTLLFDYPIGRIISEKDRRRFILTNNALEYGHTNRNENHFHYHIYDEIFFQDNLGKIETWLSDEVASKIREQTGLNYSESDNVLIIAPEHFSNSIFINSVNEILFGNSANILHFDVWKNNINNFQIFYQDLILEADKIIFVDDSMITGSTFFRNIDFIKHTLLEVEYNGDEKSSQKRKLEFDACIVLINRIDYFTQMKIWDRLKSNDNFYSFANLHLPSLKGDRSECQLCIDYEKANALFDDAFLDRFKHHYFERITKLKLRDVSNITHENRKNKKPFDDIYNNIRKIEAIHRIFEYFSLPEKRQHFNLNNVDFFDWQNELINTTDSPFEKELMSAPDKNLLPLTSTSSILLKVLAFPPFNLYKPIREKVFLWTNTLLNRQIDLIQEKKYAIEYQEDVRDLKYLIRRAGLLNSNFLLSDRFFNFIVDLYKSETFERIRREAQEEKMKDDGLFKKQNDEIESIISNIDDFGTYVISQIKELIYQNELKSIVLEKQIKTYIPSNNIQQNERLLQFFRMLQEENGILINRFWSFVKERFISIYLNKSNSSIDTDSLLNFFDKQNHYQYKALREYLEAAGEKPPLNNHELKKYLEIQAFLYVDEDDKKRKKSVIGSWSLEQKTKFIGDNLKSLVFDNVDNNKNGTFMLVKYKSEGALEKDGASEKDEASKQRRVNLFLAYNAGDYSSEIAANWDIQGSYISRFVDRTKNIYDNSIITIDKMIKNEGKWYSLYETPAKGLPIHIFGTVNDIKYLLLMRFSLKHVNENDELIGNSQGAIIFYSDTTDFSIIKTRYLLLIKQSISKFISNHHKKDEFRDWVENNNKFQNIRTISHGSDMYITIIDKICEKLEDPEQSELIKTLHYFILNKQVIIKFISDYENSKDLNKTLHENDIILKKIPFKDLQNIIRSRIKLVFSFYHSKYVSIPENYYNLNFSNNGIDNISVYYTFFNEMIFEAIYNIRKRYAHLINDKILRDNKLVIDVTLDEWQIQIKNNFADNVITKEEVIQIRNEIKYKRNKHGLNLLNTMAHILYDRYCQVRLHKDEFELSIPIMKG